MKYLFIALHSNAASTNLLFISSDITMMIIVIVAVKYYWDPNLLKFGFRPNFYKYLWEEGFITLIKK